MKAGVQLGAVTGIAVLSAIVLSACGPHSLRQAICFDSTDDCNWSVYVVLNDTERTVELRPCAHHCGEGDSRYDPVTVGPGMTSPPRQYGGVRASTGGLSWWAVETRAGKTLGCLVLDGHPDKEDGGLLRVSERRRCNPEQAPTRPVGHVSVQPP